MCFVSGYAQQSDSIRINELQKKVESQEKYISSLLSRLNAQKSKIVNLDELVAKKSEEQDSALYSFRERVTLNEENIKTISEELRIKLKESTNQTNAKLSELNSSFSQNQMLSSVGLLIVLLVAIGVFLFLGKRIKSNKDKVENASESLGDFESKILETRDTLGDMSSQLELTKKTLEEESVKLDSKLIEVLENQMKLKNDESNAETNSSNEVDHSLALKVADEIVRMQKNISKMDKSTKGLKPLLKGLERIQNNFAAKGYGMKNLLGEDYDDRMNVKVIQFIEDDSLQKGKKIITKVIKPQVNYKEKLIQKAEIEVSQN